MLLNNVWLYSLSLMMITHLRLLKRDRMCIRSIFIIDQISNRGSNDMRRKKQVGSNSISNSICSICCLTGERCALFILGSSLALSAGPRQSSRVRVTLALAHPGTSLSIRRCIATMVSLESQERLWDEEGLFGATPFLPMESSNRERARANHVRENNRVPADLRESGVGDGQDRIHTSSSPLGIRMRVLCLT